ncbi:MAG: sulfite exporter TauE/SafE family protein [Bacteroidetes bacterium]|jgi:uncharacterized membrane protein YfcA|nr:sulfite exporter TauE/SafE family protein [Bacteroidota bacterium]MBK9401774.1 sulfite exporter TauE/SafE family protein [Bacteroidota bacterium]
MEISFAFYFFLLLIACMYSCVGHGGASGYIALMSIYAFSPDFIKPAALLLNIVVSMLAFVQFYRAGYFKWELFYPFALASVPAAFLGGTLMVDEDVFHVILGLLLIFPILNLLGLFNPGIESVQRKPPLVWAFVAGGLIGFLSGVMGVGGGILLSPLLLLARWANVKETAAISALYIFVNSVAGLLGHTVVGFILDGSYFVLITVVLLGGLAGAYMGSFKLNSLVLKRVLAAVLLVATIKLIIL